MDRTPLEKLNAFNWATRPPWLPDDLTGRGEQPIIAQGIAELLHDCPLMHGPIRMSLLDYPETQALLADGVEFLFVIGYLSQREGGKAG